MASPTIGTGKGGKSFQDRQLAADVRNQALKDIHAVLKGDASAENYSEFKKAMLLKLASTLLPRLNEVTGEDGGPVEIKGVEITIRKK